MAGELKFWSSQRSKAFENAQIANGRLSASLKLTLFDEFAGASRPVPATEFLFPGAADIAALIPGVVLKSLPTPGAHDAETTKLVHVDLADPELPWRYTPRISAPIPPWMVLLVGKSASELDVAAGVVTVLADQVLRNHDLRNSPAWAHVQNDGTRSISRLLSPLRPLAAFQQYTAAIIPAFNGEGKPLWEINGAQVVRHFTQLPIALHSWRFATGAEGDFESLVELLRVRPTDKVGTIDLEFRESGQRLELRGAITRLKEDTTDPVLLAEMREALDQLNNPVAEAPDPDGTPGRDILTMPLYGRPWLAEPETAAWGRTLNDDPRYRAICGLGVWLGIEAQDELMASAVTQAGALMDISQRVRQMALGVECSTRLWSRRLPDDDALRLEVLGPATARMEASQGGSVLDYVSGPGSPLAAAQFSSAAGRLLRRGTARSRHASGWGRSDVLKESAKSPPSPDRAPSGFPHADGAIDPGVYELEPLKPEIVAVIDEFAGRPLTDDLIREFIESLRSRGYPERRLECVASRLHQANLQIATRQVLQLAARTCLARGGRDYDPGQIAECGPQKPPKRFRDFDLGKFSDIVVGAIDPTRGDSPGRTRLQDSIVGISIGSLTPPELPLGLDFPTWLLVNRLAPDWLLPGVGSVPMNSILSLQTNPEFIEAFLVGINSQFLAEARWRHLAIARGRTPLRMFWGAIDPAKGQRGPDIKPIAEWAKFPSLELGDRSHQAVPPGDPTGLNDVIILFRTDLFRRYPGTLVYLVRKPAPGGDIDARLSASPNFGAPPDATGHKPFLGPVFTGNLTADVVFFSFNAAPENLNDYWLVLDEPPAEMRFVALPYAAQGGGLTFVQSSIDRHTRVAIDGEYLERLGLA